MAEKGDGDKVNEFGFKEETQKPKKGGVNDLGFGDEAPVVPGISEDDIPAKSNDSGSKAHEVKETDTRRDAGTQAVSPNTGNSGKASTQSEESSKDGEKLKKNWWDRTKEFAKKNPILTAAIVGASLIGTGGALVGLSGGAAAGAALPMMVAGVACIAVASVAAVGYGIYKACKWLFSKKKNNNKQKSNSASQSKSHQAEKGHGQSKGHQNNREQEEAVRKGPEGPEMHKFIKKPQVVPKGYKTPPGNSKANSTRNRSVSV